MQPDSCRTQGLGKSFRPELMNWHGTRWQGQQHLSYVESGKQNVTLRPTMHLAQVVRCDVCSMLVRAQPED
jgi:hypothetical protein